MRQLIKPLPLLAVIGLAFSQNISNAVIVYVSGEGFVLNEIEDEFSSFPFSEVSETLRFGTWIDPRTDEFSWSWGSEISRVQGLRGPDSSAVRLDAGMEIGNDSAVWSNRSASLLANTDGGGNFYDAYGYIGVRVYEEIFGWDLGELPYYGWIRVEHSASSGTLTVHDWAWNSVQGEPILAGAIPEPRVYALAFGLGVFGFVLVRRLRRGRAT